MKLFKLVPAIALLVAACGGGGDAPDTDTADGPAVAPAPATPAGPTAPAGPMTIPSWYAVDHDARTVHMTLTAGSTPANNYWNYNGAISGELAITVPEGYTVTIDLINEDPNMAHSVGVSRELTNFAVPPAPDPVFPGAITPNPTSMVDGTMPGETVTITFVAETAGNYSMVCYVPGHSALGMWLFFNVSSGGEAGVQGL
jgi:FtsP/CotA-like multicopper oxidase with cupredoxin domain